MPGSETACGGVARAWQGRVARFCARRYGQVGQVRCLQRRKQRDEKGTPAVGRRRQVRQTNRGKSSDGDGGSQVNRCRGEYSRGVRGRGR